MRRIYILVFAICLHGCLSSNYKKVSQTALLKHDLNWIEAQKIFNQEEHSLKEIDQKITEILSDFKQNNTKIKDIAVPFNSKKLKFIGYLHPNSLGLFNTLQISNQNSSSINKKLYVYNYGNFYISYEDDSEINQLNIYYTIRALLILQSHFPTAYKRLFVNTKNHLSKKPKLANWSNANKCFWIAYNATPDYIAKSQTSFLSDGFFYTKNRKIGNYQNIPIIDIHHENIKGIHKKSGSYPIYRKTKDTDNYEIYMKEGLLETLTHEMLHRYIDYAYTHSIRYNKIRSFRNVNANLLAEECVVMNTSLSYFKKSRLLSDEIFTYYAPIFEANINQLKDKPIYKEYLLLFSSKNNNPREIFKLNLLEN